MSLTELEFPPIEAEAMAAAAKTSSSIIAHPAAPIDLTKVDLTDVALAMYGKWPDEVRAVKANLSTLVLDLSTPTKIKEARSLRTRLILEPLAAARKVSAGIKSKMAATSKAVGAELEKIEAGYTEADALILPKIEAREAELEREREEARQREAERKAKHQSGIDRIRAYVVKAGEPGMTAERIAIGIAQLEAIPTPTSETWEEFAVPAADAICETLARMWSLHDAAIAAECASAEAERVRRENEELRAKLAEAERQRAELAAAQALQAQQAAESAQNTPQQGANRDASAGQSHVAEGSASPTGRWADGPTACGAAPVSSPGPITMVEPPPPPADEKPTLKLGELNDWLAHIQINAAGLAELGISHSGTDKAAKLYKPSDKARIKAALIEWLERLA